MFTFRIDQAKKLFFNGKGVVDAVDKATGKNLSRIGSFIWRSARSSMRAAKKPSPPGKPPRTIKGYVKKFLFFVFDPVTRSVVIGPALLNGTKSDAPAVLEHGGTTQGTAGWKFPPGHPRKGRQKIAIKKQVVVQARPFMWPAYLKNERKIPEVWRDSVRRG